MIPQTGLNVVQELDDIHAIQSLLEQRVHALEGSLPDVQAVVDCVLERAHFDLADQLFLQTERNY